MSKSKTLKFSKDFKKLDQGLFTTIREADKDIEPGDIVYCITPTRELRCECLQVIKLPFQSIPSDQLCNDCEVEHTREARIFLENSFPDLKHDTMMKIISFIRRDIWVD